VKALGEAPLPLFADSESTETDQAHLPEMPLSQHVVEDYQTLRLSLKRHPVHFLRSILDRRGVLSCNKLGGLKNGQRVFVAGLVLVRQRPGTASGVIFVTLEDETGIANLVVWPRIFAENRAIVMGARLMGCVGKVQVEGKPPYQVVHVVADRVIDMGDLLAGLHEANNPLLKPPTARADEVTHPNGGDSRRRSEKPALVIRSRDFH